jgi:hypothetical protein
MFLVKMGNGKAIKFDDKAYRWVSGGCDKDGTFKARFENTRKPGEFIEMEIASGNNAVEVEFSTIEDLVRVLTNHV